MISNIRNLDNALQGWLISLHDVCWTGISKMAPGLTCLTPQPGWLGQLWLQK